MSKRIEHKGEQTLNESETLALLESIRSGKKESKVSKPTQQQLAHKEKKLKKSQSSSTNATPINRHVPVEHIKGVVHDSLRYKPEILEQETTVKSIERQWEDLKRTLNSRKSIGIDKNAYSRKSNTSLICPSSLNASAVIKPTTNEKQPVKEIKEVKEFTEIKEDLDKELTEDINIDIDLEDDTKFKGINEIKKFDNYPLIKNNIALKTGTQLQQKIAKYSENVPSEINAINSHAGIENRVVNVKDRVSDLDIEGKPEIPNFTCKAATHSSAAIVLTLHAILKDAKPQLPLSSPETYNSGRRSATGSKPINSANKPPKETDSSRIIKVAPPR